MVVCVDVVLFAAAAGEGRRYCVTEAVKSPEAKRRWDRQTEDAGAVRERQFLV